MWLLVSFGYVSGRAVVSAGLSGFRWSDGLAQNKEGRKSPDPARICLATVIRPLDRRAYSGRAWDLQGGWDVMVDCVGCRLGGRK